MAVKQLNIFLENRTGALAEITEILTANGIDMTAMVLADAPDYGILRLIVSDAEKAVSALREHDVIASVTGITVIKLQNVQGGLSAILQLLDKYSVGVEYMYAFVAVSGKEAYAVMRFDDKDKALGVLKDNNIALLSEDELHRG